VNGQDLTGLWQVDDGCSHQRAKDAALLAELYVMFSYPVQGHTYVANRERPSGHVFYGQLVVASLELRSDMAYFSIV